MPNYPRFNEGQSRQQHQKKPVPPVKFIAKFIIESAKVNGQDQTQQYTNNKGFLVIYTHEGSEDIFFANYLPLNKTFSAGRMIDTKLTDHPETETDYQFQLTKFKWDYKNSYDDDDGIASVELLKIYEEDETTFSCSIITKYAALVFEGYMEKPN